MDLQAAEGKNADEPDLLLLLELELLDKGDRIDEDGNVCCDIDAWAEMSGG